MIHMGLPQVSIFWKKKMWHITERNHMKMNKERAVLLRGTKVPLVFLVF